MPRETVKHAKPTGTAADSRHGEGRLSALLLESKVH